MKFYHESRFLGQKNKAIAYVRKVKMNTVFNDRKKSAISLKSSFVKNRNVGTDVRQENASFVRSSSMFISVKLGVGANLTIVDLSRFFMANLSEIKLLKLSFEYEGEE